MRLTTTALSATAALALLTACSGDAEEPAASSSAPTTTSSSAAETSADVDPEAAVFCGEAQAAFTGLESVAASADPTAIPGLLAEASQQLAAIEPPAEISESWTVLTGALDQTVGQIQGLDLATPEGQEAFLAAVTALQTTSTDAQTEVETYVTANCDTGAAPTS